ncbi:hypothetical protein AVEN_137850-1, partial [Araneus ventricosus]
MTHFVSRFCTQLASRLSFRVYSTWKQKTVIGLTNSNKYVPHPFSCCKPKWMSSSAHSDTVNEEELGEQVKFYFKIHKTGEIVEATAREGQTVMAVAVGCEINMEVHVGNKAVDLLAKKTTLEGITTQYPGPRSFLKKKLHAISNQRWQNEWDNGDTRRNFHLIFSKVKTSPAPWQRPEIMLAMGHGPFPTYRKRFSLRMTDYC